MSINTIDAQLLKKCFLAGAKSLEIQKERINELNVFPVPDGDTGTNMTMTIMSAAKEVNALTDPSMEALCKAISSGSLRGARGNSGVILSQLLRGFTKGIAEYKEITVDIMVAAFTRAVETAYKAVMKPKEGTILTVAKGGAEKANELVGKTTDILEFASIVIEHMEKVLEYTPELLPVLKEAGVVDSGGQGLVEILHGVNDCLNGKEFDFDAPVAGNGNAKATGAASNEISTADIKFGYCTEFIIMLEKEYTMATEFAFKEFLESIGDSIVVVSDDDIVKVHVHTNDPGLAIQRALTYGSLTKMKIDNMREEHNERVFAAGETAGSTTGEEQKTATVKEEPKKQTPKKDNGFVVVSIGKGMSEIFESLGTDKIIEGGQTMNPSTEDILKAIDEVNADTVYVFPNNKNIILAANQAQALTEDKKVVVVPTKTVPQGIAALIAFSSECTPEVNLENMMEECSRVKSGQVTYAVRDTSIDGVEIHMGDIMGLGDKTILSVGKDIEETSFELISKLVDEDSAVVSIYFGEEIGAEAAGELTERVQEAFPDVEVETYSGGQPIYYYVISVE